MYDYVIVGGGSAGCVLAARLSEMPDARVLMVEAGPRDTDPFIHMPVGFFKMTAGPLTWGYETAPLRHANNRVAVYPQARVLGGGSSINAEIYTRGCPEDYDGWASTHGCDGWAWKDLRQYFIKSEGNSRLGGAEHGVDGPLGVSDLQTYNRVSMAYVQGCMDIGMPYNPDFNSGKQEGAGLYQTTTLNGRRCSAAVGYLKPVMGRPNLEIRTGVSVNRIIIENGRAKGIEIVEGGATKRIDASQEVIVTAGAIGSPKLLMLSGIGPAAHLNDVGVNVLHDLPGVGQNFHDHFSTDVTWVLNGDHSYDKYKKKHWQLWAGLQYLMFKSGPVASNIVEAGAFWWSDRNEKTPDLQFHFLAGAGVEEGVGTVPGGNGATCNSYHVRPKSRGYVKLRSSNPTDAPLIDPNSFAEPYDLDRHIDGIKITQEVGRSRAMRKFVTAEHFPGPGVKTRQDYEDIARANARSSYHPVGTCKMGTDDMAVIDPQLRVRGIESLRVCDSSIMPEVVSSNTNAPTIAIAEKAADLIRGNR
ncbi:MAG: GMC family oxidoreductase N-terminal domain-containing protein [Alphaproteobacteria bacterium]|nr:GMC family oxidoreductase N-terminal domain-containing protein [Alphaproteobacteria bacterium]